MRAAHQLPRVFLRPDAGIDGVFATVSGSCRAIDVETVLRDP